MQQTLSERLARATAAGQAWIDDGLRCGAGGESDHTDTKHTGCIERSPARFERRTRRDHVVDQHDVRATGARRSPERGLDVAAPRSRGQAALLRSVPPAFDELGREARARAPTELPSKQPGRVEAAFDESCQMQRDGHDLPGFRAIHWPGQQPRQGSSQIGSMAELQARDGGRQRRRVGASHPAKAEAAGARWRRAGAAAVAEELARGERNVAARAIVGSQEISQRAGGVAAPARAATHATVAELRATLRRWSAGGLARHSLCIERRSAEVAAESLPDTRSLGSQTNGMHCVGCLRPPLNAAACRREPAHAEIGLAEVCLKGTL